MKSSAAAAAAPTRSLTDIMDEELARKLQAEEEALARAEGLVLPADEEAVVQEPTGEVAEEDKQPFEPPCCTKCVDAKVAEQILADEELARKLQAEEEDMRLAMQLQEQLATPKKGPSSADAYDEAAFDHYEEGDDDEESARHKQAAQNNAAQAAARRNKRRRKKKAKAAAQAQAQTQAQTQTQAANIVTKHDPETSGRQNAANLQRFIDSDALEGPPAHAAAAASEHRRFEEEEAALDAGCDEHAVRSIPNKPYTAIREHTRKLEARKMVRYKEHRDAPQRKDTVLDEAAELTILSLLDRGVLESLHGVISAGKEAHVYHATAGDARVDVDDVDAGAEAAEGASTGDKGEGEDKESTRRVVPEGWECALKVFKAVNEFKNRGAYMLPAARAEFERTKQHPRACVRLWAQRELKHLEQLCAAGIRCPQPIGLYGDAVLVMRFLGSDGVPAPTLHEVDARVVSVRRWAELYRECVLMARAMHRKCGLVHGDLSEYNILLWNRQPWFIDVAQAVSTSHEDAQDFLLRDCTTLNAFFGRRGVATLDLDTLFRFVNGTVRDSTEETTGTEETAAAAEETKEETAKEKREDEEEAALLDKLLADQSR